MRKCRKMVALGLILSMALSAAACSSGGGSAESKNTEAAAPAETTAEAAKDTTAGESSQAAENAGGELKTGVKVTLIPKIRQEAFWNAVEAGAQAAADKLEAKLTIQGDPSGSNTAAKQATYVEAAMEKGQDAICFAALDSNTTDAALQAAMKAGVKVVGFDSDPGVEARDYFVNQADPEGIAVAGLDDIAKQMNDKGFTADKKALVYLVSTNPTTPNQNTWIEYIKKNYFSDYEIPMGADGAIDFDKAKEQTKKGGFTVAEKYANLDIKVNPDSEIIYGGDDYQTSKTQVGNTLAANPDTNALFVLTTNAISATYEAITEKGMEKTCIFNGIAVPTDAKSYLEEGVMSEVILWQAYDLGYLAVESAVRAVSGDISGDRMVSTLSGTDQVAGVSTYPAEGHKIVNGKEIILGDPAVFVTDTVDKFKN